jgi:hypothetical protein
MSISNEPAASDNPESIPDGSTETGFRDTAEPITAAQPTFGSEQPARKPRIRAGAITWGVLVSAASLAVLLIVASPERRSSFGDWLNSLNVASISLLSVLALGVVILLITLLSGIRKAQRAR